METQPKYYHSLSFIFLIFLLNPLQFLSHASSPLDFLKPLIGTHKGNTAPGLSHLKKYLTNLGYIPQNSPTKNDDFFDDTLESAIKKYQQFFKLAVNGVLDANTVAKLRKPRCGVPDFPQSNRNHRPTNTSSKYNFFHGEPKWPPSKYNLTYSFTQGTRPDVNPAILVATRLWAGVSPFKFFYIPAYNYKNADIKITFEFRDHGDGLPFDGPGGILAHAFEPTDGRLHYDGDEMWRNGVFEGAFDIQTVGLHELGHVLGLEHSSDERAIMWPYIDPETRKGLGEDDINGIRALYQF